MYIHSIGINTPAGTAKVFLVRARDGFHIPYARQRVVTLIALLRMDLHKLFRDRQKTGTMFF